MVVSRAPVGRGRTQRPLRGARTACGREAQADASEWGGARIIAFVEARFLGLRIEGLGLNLEGSASFFHFFGVRQLCCRSLGPVEGVAI